MSNRDDLLQNHIAMLEAGTPLEEVLVQLPPDQVHLYELLKLTAAIRAVPAPELSPAATLDTQMYAAIERHARRQKQVESAKRPLSFNRLRDWSFPRLALSGLAVTALIIFGLVWLISLSSLAQPVMQPVSVLALTSVSGQVELSDADSGVWRLVEANEPLLVGQHLRSGPGSQATLQFEDGSQIILAANSELSLRQLLQQPGDTVTVELMQHVGQSQHQVTPLRSPDAFYVVHTPSVTAEVRGTTFSVAVAATGHTYVAVDEGQVLVTAASTTVPLNAGHATTISIGQAPASPVRYFRSQGELLRQEQMRWQIDELLVYLTEETILNDAFAVGDWVEVSGRILPNGRWLADSINLTQAGHQAAFAGVIEAISPRLWLVDDIAVAVTAETERPSDLAVGDLVRVVYRPGSDGQRLALQIDLLRHAVAEPPPLHAAGPSLSFEPDELEATGCQTEFALTGFLVNDGEPPRDVAAEVALGYAVLTGARFVEAVAIEPSGWSLIDAGETAVFTVQIETNAAWLLARPETEVKLHLFVAAENNRPASHPTRLTITLVQSCAPATIMATTTAATPAATATMTPLPPNGDCTGISPHPQGVRLAQLYGVPYADIIGWFCEGFGFGEIDLAYGLSQDTGTAVADIFDMRRQGLGWGEIMQVLGAIPGPPNNPPPGPPTNPPAATPTMTQPAATATIPTNTPPASATDEPTPPITPPGPSMTPPTPPGPYTTPPGSPVTPSGEDP
jgi:hypothetical protein